MPRSSLAKFASRSARRAIARLTRRGVLAFSPEYSLEIPATGIDGRRAERILAFLDLEGLAVPGGIVSPRAASARELQATHDPAYLDSLHAGEALERVFGVGLPGSLAESVIELQAVMTGGTILAARSALERCGVAVNLGGGFHHAHADRGGGFCLFNDIAVAVCALGAGRGRPRALVVDLDVHDGDGTRAIFRDDPAVHTFSVHDRDWDEIAATESTSVALGPGVGDDAYLHVLRERLPALVERFDPDVVFYLAGTDVAASDPRGAWEVSDAGVLARDRFVFELMRERTPPLPLAITLGGGYGDHAWRLSARFVGWILAGGRAFEPPATGELLSARYRRLAKTMSRADLRRDDGESSWTLDPSDVHEALAVHESPSRWLGYYTRRGLELALERYGFLEELRRRGFEDPVIEVFRSDAGRHGLRVYGSPDRRELLVELIVWRDRSIVPGQELLAVEWLLLQNPRESFAAVRPRLPGQEHPGLGLLREVAGLLVLICKRLQLDGIVFVPSHYHLAVQSMRHLRFLDPAKQEEVRALHEALEGIPLPEAADAIERGQVVEARSGEPYAWEPAPMVLAVSERLRAKIDSLTAAAPPRAASSYRRVVTG